METQIDPDVVSVMTELGARPEATVLAAELTAEQLRQRMRDANAVFTRDVDPIQVHEVTDEYVPGSGGKIPVRLYRPHAPTAVIAYFHGGSWRVGDVETHDLVTRRLCRDTGAVVISVDYRLLPEHSFPAPLNDAYDATTWVRARWPDLPLLVAGDSAGGTLAACVALRSRDEDGPRIDGQVLVYPGIDDDLDSPSMHTYQNVPGVSLDNLRFFLHDYGSTGAAVGSPYALPARATSLAGLPPAVMVIAGNDPLRSSEERYAARLARAGVPVTVQLDPTLIHAWVEFAERVPAAGRAFERLTAAITRLLGAIG